MLSIALLAAATLASAHQFYTELTVDGSAYWNKLTKNSSTAYAENNLYWDYYSFTTDAFSSHVHVNVSWDTAQWAADGHQPVGAMMVYVTKEGFPAPGMHWDWTDKTEYQDTQAMVDVSPSNLPPNMKIMIGVAGHHGAVYNIQVSSFKGVYLPPVEIEANKEYKICDWKTEENGENDIHYCDLIPNQYNTYYVQTEDSCQHKDDCCYAVVFKGEFKPEDGFRAYVNPSHIQPTRAHHKYIFAPIMTWHDGWMDPDRRDPTKANHYDVKMNFDEVIHLDGDGIYLPPEEAAGVHDISVTVTVGPLFYVTNTDKKDGKTIKMKVIELEGEACYPTEYYQG